MGCCLFRSRWRIRLLTHTACCTLLSALSVFVWWHRVYISATICWIWSLIACTAQKTRPLAAGTLPIQTGMVAAIVLLLAAFALAHLQPREFIVILLGYWTLTVLYSLLLKRLFFLDLLTLASLYSMRLEAGAQAAQVNASIWLLGFSMTLFFGLAVLKRVVELSKSTHAAALPGRAYTGAI